jgi:hypothetical protein
MTWLYTPAILVSNFAASNTAAAAQLTEESWRSPDAYAPGGIAIVLVVVA